MLNPFEVRVNRSKFHVLGRKSKNDWGLPGIARAKSIKKVILSMYLCYNIRVFNFHVHYHMSSNDDVLAGFRDFNMVIG